MLCLCLRRCDACTESFLQREAIRARFNLPCGHAYCNACMGELMQRALADTALLPLRCCKQEVDDAYAPAVLHGKAAGRYT